MLLSTSPAMPLPTRKIGTSDVTAIGFGAMGLSAFYGPPKPDEERFKASLAYYTSCVKTNAQYIP